METTAIATIIARTTSTRLPLKCLRSIDSQHRNMLNFIIERCLSQSSITRTVLCTSEENVDDIMEDIAVKSGADLYRGASESVIDRLISVAKTYSPKYVVRITGDNVFTATELIDAQVNAAKAHDLDYVRLGNCPLGTTAEIIKTEALFELYDT